MSWQKFSRNVNWDVVILFELAAIVLSLISVARISAPAVVAAAYETRQEVVTILVPPVEAVVDNTDELVMRSSIRVKSDVEVLAELVPSSLFKHSELADVVDACKTNGCWTKERLALVMAIRKAESGGKGFEYGCVNKRGGTYRQQVGACAATVRNFLTRNSCDVTDEAIGRLARQYAPYDVHTWYPNVTHWYARFLPVTEKLNIELANTR